MYNELAKQYDQLCHSHDEDRENYNNQDQLLYLNSLIPKGANILDAGCGTGYPVIKFFNDNGHTVIGTDISQGQLNYVQKHAPGVKTIQCSTSDLNFSENTFDLITSFYSFMHLTMTDQEKALQKIQKMLKYNGYLYLSLATKEFTGVDEFEGMIDYEDFKLPINHTTPKKYVQMIENLNLTVLKNEVLETGKDIRLLWILAKKV